MFEAIRSRLVAAFNWLSIGWVIGRQCRSKAAVRACNNAFSADDPRQRHEPLVITGHGMRLRVDNGALVIRDGFTHHPQELRELRFFPGAPNLPSRIVALDGSGSLSFDVMDWLAVQRIPLIRIDWRGNVVTVLSHAYGLNPKHVKSQLDAIDHRRGLSIAISLI